MYSTPGISHSSFSIGLVTRSSTSRAEAPGICTKTSTIGTMICGSSSRGSFQTANAPSSSEAAITSGVSFELIKVRANRPAVPSDSGDVTVRSPRERRHSARAAQGAPACPPPTTRRALPPAISR